MAVLKSIHQQVENQASDIATLKAASHQTEDDPEDILRESLAEIYGTNSPNACHLLLLQMHVEKCNLSLHQDGAIFTKIERFFLQEKRIFYGSSTIRKAILLGQQDVKDFTTT
jgi:hypothetical protein